MANHNYSQYSNNKKSASKTGGNKTETTVAAPVEPLVVTATPAVKMVVETVETTKPMLVRETVETKELPKTVIGIVANCSKLNVRANPTLTADVVCVLDANSKLFIDPAKSNREWCCVAVDNGDHGYNGYCMKKYVNVKL